MAFLEFWHNGECIPKDFWSSSECLGVGCKMTKWESFERRWRRLHFVVRFKSCLYAMQIPLPTPTPIVHRSCIHHLAPSTLWLLSFTSRHVTPIWLVQNTLQVLPLDVLAQPPDTLSVTLPHDHTAHENLDRSNALKRYLALASGLVQAECRAKLVFRHGLGMINLVTENNERGVFELLHGEEGVEFGLGFVEALVVLCVDEEDNAGDFRDCAQTLLVVKTSVDGGLNAYSSRAKVVAPVRDHRDRRL
jgi:hypothetical protein